MWSAVTNDKSIRPAGVVCIANRFAVPFETIVPAGFTAEIRTAVVQSPAASVCVEGYEAHTDRGAAVPKAPAAQISDGRIQRLRAVRLVRGSISILLD